MFRAETGGSLSEGTEGRIPSLRALQAHAERLGRTRDTRRLQSFEIFSPSNFTILVLDELPAALSAVAELLRSVGFRVLTACSAEGGLELMVRRKVDVVVCGAKLGNMSGCEFADRIKSYGSDCHSSAVTAPIVLLASEGDGSAQQSLKSAADLVCLREKLATMLVPQLSFLLR